MSQTDDRVAQLENEILSLKKQLTHTQGNIPEQALNSLFTHGREVVFHVVNDERLTVTQISDSISTYGYSPEEFTSGRLGWRDVLYPKDIEPLFAYIAAELAKGAISVEHEHRVYTKPGEVVWITCVSMPETNAEGKITHFWVKIKDVSRRKRYEDELQDANENLFVTLKSIGEAVIQTNAGGYIERLNGAAEKLIGIINLKARNKHLRDIMQFCYKADFATPVHPLELKVETCKMVEIDEIFMRFGDHSRTYRVSCNISPIFIGKNKAVPDGYVLVVKDLTTIYNALQAAQESEARMQESESTIRGIFDHSADGMLLADHNGIVREWSSGYERITGLTKEATVGKFLWDVAAMGFPPEQLYGEEREKLDNELKELVDNMRLKMITRHVIHRKTGEHRILNIQYFSVAMPGRTMLGAISRDVTEEVQAQELISRNEQILTLERDRLKTLGDNMPNGCLYQFTLNTQTQQMGFTYMSQSWEEITGISVEAAMADLNQLLGRIHPDDLPVYLEKFGKSQATMGHFMVEVRFMIDSGAVRWGRISSTPHLEGINVVWDGFIVDITDYKQAEQRLTAEMERLQALGDNMPNGCLYRTVTDPKTMNIRFVYLSSTFEHLMNLPVEKVLHDFTSLMERVHPDDQAGMIQNITQAAQMGTDYNDEVRFYYNSNDIRWYQISSHPHIENGMLVYDGFILDITMRKEAELELVDEKNRLQALGDNMPDGCLFRFMMNTETRKILGFTYLSQTWQTITGIPVEDTLTDFESTLARVHPDDLPVYVQAIDESAANMSKFIYEFRFRRDDGYTLWLKASSSPRIEDNMVVWDGFIVDITDRKLSEQALIAEKDRLQALGDHFPNGCLFRFDFDGENRKFSFTYLSKTWEKLSNLKVEEALNDMNLPLSRLHPDDRGPLVDRIWETYDQQQENFDAELRFYYTPDEIRWVQISTHRHFENGRLVSDGFILDITDRKIAEEQIAEEQAKLKSVTDNLPNGCICQFAINTETQTMRMAYIGENWERILNSPADASKENANVVFAKVHEDDYPVFMTEVMRVTLEMVPFNVECRYWYTGDDLRWLQVSGAPHREGEWIIFDGLVMDITDRKKAEQQLLAEKERVETLGNNLPNGSLFRFRAYHETQALSFEYVSATWERTTGVPEEATLENVMAVMGRIHPDDMPGLMSELIRSCVELSNVDAEARYLHPDGSLRWMHIASHPHVDNGTVVSDGFLLDITARKKAEQDVRIEKERLQALGDNMPNGTLFRFKMDTQTNHMSFDYLSGTWETMSGITIDETLADMQVILAHVSPDDLPQLLERITTSVGMLQNIDTEIRYLHPDGTTRVYQVSSHPHREGDIVYSDGFILDITARKKAETALFAEKERLQALGDNFPDGTLFRFKMDLQTELMSFDYVSGTWEKTVGVPVEDSLADISTVFAHVMPDDLPGLIIRIRESASRLENIDTEVRYLHPVVGLRWYQISSHPHREGHIVYSDGFILDVTARKDAEEELRSEKDRLEALGNNIPGGCLYRFSLDPALGELKMMYASATWDEVTGVPAERAMVDVSTVFERVVPEDYLRMMEVIEENVKTLSNFNMELRFVMNGETRWLQMISRPHTEDHLVVWDGILLDITWRKEAERELTAEKDRLEAVGNNLPEGSLYRLVLNNDTGKMYMEYVSGTWETIIGLTPESVTTDMAPFFNIVYPDDLQRLMEASQESEKNLTNANVEIRINHHGGTRWIQIASHPHTEGNTVVWDGIMTDITRRKEAERELETEKDRLQALGDNIPGGCLYRFILDIPSSQMRVSYVSATWEAVTSVPAEAALADITSVFAAVHPDDVPYLQQSIQESAQTLTNFNCEIRLANHLRPRWVQMASHPHIDGTSIIWDGIILDVTRRKEAEQELRSEKDRLQALGDNFPGGTLFRFQIDAGQFARSDIQTWMQHLKLSYASDTWEKISNIPLDDALRDVSLPFMRIDPDDLSRIVPEMYSSLNNLIELNVEIRYKYSNTEMKWLQIAAVPRHEDGMVVTDGFILDITERKKTEEELAVYRVELERLVKERTEELEATNEELYATNEELYATNEEFAVTNEELHTKNDQLRTEIAARMEVMRKLEDSENKVRNFIGQSFEGIMILDEQGRVIEWNEALEKMTGLSHSEALGKYEWDLLRKYLSKEERDLRSFEKLRQSRLKYLEGCREQEPTMEELTLHMPNGSKRYMQVSMFPIGLAETCYFGRILHDITEQKLADMELEQYRTQLEQMVELKTRELVASQERLTSLSDNLPGGVIYQMMDRGMTESWFTYISGYFADMFEISIEDAMADITVFHNSIYPGDQSRLIEFYNKDESQNNIDVEYRIVTKSGKLKWIHMRSSHHSNDDGARVWDGFMIDVTARKQAEQELENTRRQQAILIKVLQIVQSAENLPGALSASLAEMGRYTGVSRVYIFEKSADRSTVSNTYEWCNDGIVPTIDALQDVPAEYMQPWFDVFNSGKYICTADVNTLGTDTAEALSAQGVKSIVVFPLSANGVNYGFVGFDECSENREWEKAEVDLLISLSQIISTTTRRHHAETAMQLSQQTMRTVLDNIDANIYVADFDSHEVLFANKKVKETMGDDIEGKACWKVMQENQTSQCGFCPNPRLRDKQGHPTGLYHWEQWNTNTKKWYEATDAAIEWVDGRLVHMEYATDITDRKKAEEAVRQSEEMYRQLTVASPDAVIVCNPDGQLRYVSPKASALFGVEEDTDVSLLRILRFIHPHDRRQAYSLFSKMNTDNVTFLPQLLLVRQDGSDFIGEISVATVKNSDGHTTSLIMVIRDITRRKMDEMELIRAKEKAEESDKLKSAFLANMSHEIRTPINGIIGFLHFLGSDSLSPKRRQEYINIINNSSIQLVKLIDDIIDVAKIEAKQMNIRPVPLHINELMRELQVFFETYVQANNKERIALILDDSQAVDSCITYVDPMRLRQVLNNLIGNAVKFTEKGFIRIGYRQSAPDLLEFVVEDSGIGLAPDQLEVIFERFRQAELSNNRQYGGTGLGLTISRSLVQLMGGDMWVESTEGSGSTFYFTISYLPVTSGDEQIFEETPEDESPEDNPFSNKSILVVEPKPMKFKYYEKLISATGAKVTQAETLQQWLDFITQSNHIDTVIADVSVLKDEDIDNIRRIKYVRAGLPVILIVPGQKEDYQQVIRDSQCNMTIEIPVDSVEIERVLKRYAR